MRVLEVSLRKAGFTVTPASSVADAIDKLEIHAPDLIISETSFPDGDGFELRRRVRGTPEWAEIPFVFLTSSTAIENKIRGLELGVDDYLTKPIYIKEIITRINILLQKKQRTKFEERRDGRTRFAGRVHDMPVVDVIQTIEISRKSGVIQFVGERNRQAAIYFRDGKVIDAEAGALQGEDAVYRLLTWGEGEFEVIFRTVRRREVIIASSQALLMEGMRRLDEWSRLLEQLPPLTHRFEVDVGELSGRLGEVPDDNNRILRLIDGKRTLLEVIDSSDCGDLECLQAISRLYFEELLIDLDHGAPQRRDSRPMPAIDAEIAPTPIEEVASGPHAMEDDVAQESDVISEEPVGPLMGGYRPSGLRLIDEAVAAAQAIEPSLFADEPRDGTVAHVIESDQPPPGSGPVPKPRVNGESQRNVAPSPAAQGREDAGLRSVAAPPAAQGREDSGLRMIGSHGRDRAEASGEFAVIRPPPPVTNEPQRELVTILPRRITREFPIVDASGATPAATRPNTPSSGTPIIVATDAMPATTPPSPMPGMTDPAGTLGVGMSGAAAPGASASPIAGTPESEASGRSSPMPGTTWLGTSDAAGGMRGASGTGPSDAGPWPSPIPGTTGLAATRLSPMPGTQAPGASAMSAGARGVGDGADADAIHGEPGVGTSPREAATRASPMPGTSGPVTPAAKGPELTTRDRSTLLGVGADPAVARTSTGSRGFESVPISARGTAELDALEDDVARPRARMSAPVVARPLEPLPPAPKLPTGSGVRRRTGPGTITIVALVVAGILAVVAIYLKLRKTTPTHEEIAATLDAGAVAPPPDAKKFTITPLAEDAAPPDTAEIEMEPEHMKADAAVAVAPKPDAGVDDKQAQAKQLMEQAVAALQEGAFQKGLELADQSLKLRRAARTLLVRATAQQRLQRYDDALKSIDEAAEVYKQALGREYPGAWEQKGQLLWSVRRYDEARAALEHYLELEPNGPRADRVRKLLEQTP